MTEDLPTVFHNGQIIDGRGGLFNGYIVVSGSLITAVGKGEPTKQAATAGANFKDLAGRFVLPGLIDCHVHLSMDALPSPRPLINQHDQLVGVMTASKNALRTLHAGITTVRDCGTPGGIDFALRQAAADGLCITPRLFLSGRAICMTGGHGWQLLGHEIDGPDAVRKAARALIKLGADNIKVIATGGILTPGTSIGAAQLGVDEMRAAVEEAQKADKTSAAHAHGAQGIKNAARAGVSSVEHAYFIDPEGIDLMLEHGTVLVATSAAVRNVVHNGTSAGIPADMVAKAASAIEAHVSGFTAAHRAGVKLAMGTDSGVPFTRHGHNLDELTYLVKMGLSSMEAIQVATRDSAELLNLGDKIGTLEVGKLADLIVVDGDPLADVSILTNHERIRLVVLNGKTVMNRDLSQFLVGTAFGAELNTRVHH